MSLFVNCAWYPPEGAGIHDRIGQIARLLEREETVAVVGRNWYRKGYSKKQALSKPLSLAKLGEVGSWKPEPIAHGEIEYSLGVWNGRDAPDGVSLLVFVHEPTRTEMDTLLFSGPDLESLTDKWRSVLAWGEAIAAHLKGLSVVGSHKLRDWAEAEGIEQATWAAHAAFDGRDGRSVVSSATWPEVLAPDRKRVQEYIRVFLGMARE